MTVADRTSKRNSIVTMTKRAVHLDAVGGLLIVWMILVHIQSLTQSVLIRNRYMPLLFCFMAWFFFKAGMFFREKPLREELKGIWKRLLLPYIFFSVIGVLCGFVIECVLGTESIPHYLLRSAGQVVRWGGGNFKYADLVLAQSCSC